MRRVLLALAAVVLAAIRFSAQQTSPPQPVHIDFVRDVQPIFRQHCYECHGPERQSNGLRLDRRKSAFMGGTEVILGRGSAQSSRLYLRLIGSDFGEQMPKEGTITPAEIETIRAWIDQGAEWPDDASGDAPATPNGGTTPLMEAALRADTRTVRRLLSAGANPNQTNDAGATALMWGLTSLDTTRALLEAGADVNAKSDDARTPLLIACGLPEGTAVARLLLQRGAKLDARAPWLGEQISCLSEAARTGNAALVREVMSREVKPDQARALGLPLAMALRSRCEECIDAITKGAPPALLGGAMAASGPPLADATAMLSLLARGADAKATHPFIPGVTMLMAAAASDATAPGVIRALLDRGVDPNAAGPGGMTALAIARQRGQTPIVEMLLAAGAKDAPSPAPLAVPAHAPAVSPRAAIERSLPLLQRADVAFLRKSGCVSCHNNSLTAITMALARRQGLRFDEQIAASQARKSASYLADWRDRVLQNHGIPGDVDSIGYILMGLAAERHTPDAATAAMARYVRLQQDAGGSWLLLAHRPPIESSEIEVTVSAIRSLQIYAAKDERALAKAAIRRATAWLRRATPLTTEDRAFQLLGFAWTGSEKGAIRAAGQALVAQQRRDGGWSQLPYLESDAYATGQALVSLVESGALATSDPAYRRGVEFLVSTQMADGSWFVPSRAIAIQPPLDAEFPHGKHQFISAAGTNWATQALLYAVPSR